MLSPIISHANTVNYRANFYLLSGLAQHKMLRYLSTSRRSLPLFNCSEGVLAMTDKELISVLRRLRVQTGNFACLGCGYEHNCGIHGCRILRDTADRLERLTGGHGSQKVMEYRDGS